MVMLYIRRKYQQVCHAQEYLKHFLIIEKGPLANLKFKYNCDSVIHCEHFIRYTNMQYIFLMVGMQVFLFTFSHLIFKVFEKRTKSYLKFYA